MEITSLDEDKTFIARQILLFYIKEDPKFPTGMQWD